MRRPRRVRSSWFPPLARNGVTLLQRLVNSCRRLIDYGESRIVFDDLPQAVHAGVDAHQRGGAELKASRQRFLSGDDDYWSSNLCPDSEKLMLAMSDCFHSVADLYDKDAREPGFMRWGVKNPMLTLETIRRLMTLMPGARFIFIHRDPFDVVRSAKARSFAQSLDDVSR